MNISVSGSRTSFGRYLRDLRRRKGIESPAELSRLMKGRVSVSGILKRERGELKITPDYAKAFIQAVKPDAEEEKHLREHLSLFQLQFDVWRSGKSLLQINHEAAARLEGSKDIRCYSPTFIPHLLQTPAYIRGILETYRFSESDHELKDVVRVRTRNSSRILKDSVRTMRLINSEAALYTIFGSVNVLVEQLIHLLKLGDKGQIQYRILPLGTKINLPIDSTFTIYDGMFVAAESTIGNLYTGDQDKSAWVTAHFGRLWEAGLPHREHKHLIEEAIMHLRSNDHMQNSPPTAGV